MNYIDFERGLKQYFDMGDPTHIQSPLKKASVKMNRQALWDRLLHSPDSSEHIALYLEKHADDNACIGKFMG